MTSAPAEPDPSDCQRFAAEGIGTLLLLAVIIGSGLMAERLAGGNVAIALLANTAATVGGLYVLIEVFGPMCGAHFNPAVSIVTTWRGAMPRSRLLPYIGAQLLREGSALRVSMKPAKRDLEAAHRIQHDFESRFAMNSDGTFGFAVRRASPVSAKGQRLV